MPRWLVILIGASGLLGLAAFWLTRPPSRARFDAVVAAEKAAGRPVTFEEMAGEIPAADVNGDADLEAAVTWLAENRPTPWRVAGPWSGGASETWYDDESPSRLAELDRFMTEARPFFELVVKAAAKPTFEARVSRNGMDLLWEPQVTLSATEQAAKVLHARALGAADAGHRLDAMRLIAALASRREEHSLRESRRSADVMTQALHALRRDLERGAADPIAARAAMSPHLGRTWTREIPRCAATERVWYVEAGERLAAGKDVGGYTIACRTTSTFGRLQESVESLFDGGRETGVDDYADAIVALGEVSGVPADSYIDLAAAMADWAAAQESEFVTGLAAVSPRTAEHFARTDAQQRLARIALAAAEHRQTRGEYPASLADLAWAFPAGSPLDPFTDAPFVYERTANGARIASLGRLADEPPLDEATLRERVLVWELKR